MAVLEQLVFGHSSESGSRRQILGYSPGLVGDCAQEAMRLCEGWGAVPAAGLRRPVLMSFPLVTRLPGMPGDLYAVIRIAPGLKPIFHALVMTRADYLAFALNPFTLAQEDIFLSQWEDGDDLPRRELAPKDSEPLVASSCGPGDVGSIDEAVRQMLANQRLLLPLEQSSSDSDRFLALTIASLPRVLRQDLRFASWAPSGTNRYSLAATYRESALFTSWQPYLMTTVLGDLGPSGEEYLKGLQRCLREGDLAGIERLSAGSRIQLGHLASKAKRGQNKVLTATVPQEFGGKGDRRRAAPVRKDRAAARGGERSPSPDAAAGSTPSRARTRPYRPSDTGGAQRLAAIVLSLAILAAGGYFLRQSNHWQRLPNSPAGEVGLPLADERGPVSVSTLYERWLAEPPPTGRRAGAGLDRERRRQGLLMLAQVKEQLEEQEREFAAEAEQVLSGTGPVAGAALGEMQARGSGLARELRLLALAQVSWREQVDWRDLTALEPAAVQARLDSLLAHHMESGPLEPAFERLRQQLRGLDQRGRHLAAVATLERLLQQGRWEPGWDQLGETAIDALVGVRHGRIKQLRDDALLLFRLKRAEHATGVAARAFVSPYGPLTAQTPAVADILPELQARAREDQSAGQPPALLSATVAFYETLAAGWSEDVSLVQLAAACETLAANRAVAFDPQIYGDHLARLRFRWLASLIAAGVPADNLPAACFGGGQADEHLAFLALLADDSETVVWKQQAEILTDPFLIRWSLDLAGQGGRLLPATASAE